MLRGPQFSVSAILLLVLVVAILLRWPEQWLITVIAEGVAILVCVEYLIRKIPIGIKSIMQSNCNRIDGSRSGSREYAENRAIRKLRWNLMALFLIVLIPVNLMFWIASIDQRWFSLNEQQEKVVSTNSNDANEPGTVSKSKIRMEFKVIAVTIALGWLVFGCWIVKTGYIHSLNELLKSAKLRAQEYQLQDLSMVAQFRVDSTTESPHPPKRHVSANGLGANLTTPK